MFNIDFYSVFELPVQTCRTVGTQRLFPVYIDSLEAARVGQHRLGNARKMVSSLCARCVKNTIYCMPVEQNLFTALCVEEARGSELVLCLPPFPEPSS